MTQPPGWPALVWRRFKRLLGEVRADRTLRLVVLGLFAVDLGWTLWFGVAKLLDITDIDPSWYELKHLRITKDGSWPEWFNYAKTLGLVVLLGRLTVRLRQPVYGTLAILFAVILVDDSFGLHESWGLYFADTFGFEPMFGLRARDFGEMLTWAIFAHFLVPLLFFGFVRSAPAHRINGLALMLPFVALLFCAVVLDQLYHALRDSFFGAGILLDMAEDGGEMMCITLAVAVTAALLKLEHGGAAGSVRAGDDA